MRQIIDSATVYFCSVLLPNSGLIWMLVLLFFFGFLVTSMIMIRTGELITEKNEPSKDEKTNNSPAQKPLTGEKVGLIALTRKTPKAFSESIKRMPPRSVRLLLKWLKLDYWFMFFLYPCLSFLILLLTRYTTSFEENSFWKQKSIWLICLPLVAGLLDVLENLFATFAIVRSEQTNSTAFAKVMRCCSFAKWSLVVLVVLAVVVVTIALIIAQIRQSQ